MARHLPPEWAPQGAVLLVWPHENTDWGTLRMDPVEDAFAALCAAITRHEPLVLACRDERTREHALAKIAAAGSPWAAVATVLIDTDDTWTRDIAPLTVLDDEHPVLVDFGFNGWGGQFAHAKDAAFGANLVDSAGFATLGYERCELVLEGGAVETDGQGTFLVNRPTLLDPARNPDADEETVERTLRERLGAERVHWLDVPPLEGDDTRGHIDTLARFCGPETIAHAAPHGEGDPNTPTLQALAEQLRALRTPDGQPYHLVPLPAPEPIVEDPLDENPPPVPASYANFLVINEAVLVPSFADARDADAIEALQPLFPERTVVPVPARTFIGQSGSIHCLTMQFPEGVFEDLVLT